MLLNLHIDRVRKEARHPGRVALEPNQLGAECEPALDRAGELDVLLGALDEPGRTLLLRFHHDGRSIGELSEELSLPAGTIKSHLHRARRFLAERFRLGPDGVVERRASTQKVARSRSDHQQSGGTR